MATYQCEKCDMSVNATCGHCDAALENGMLELPEPVDLLFFIPLGL